MLVAKTALILSGTGLVAFAALTQTAQAQLPTPENFWPTTVTGWMTLFLSFSSAVGLIYAVHRSSLQPLRLEIAQLKEATAAQVAQLEEDWNKEFNNFRESLTAQVNGWGARVTTMEQSQVAQQQVLTNMLSELAQSRQDRIHIHAILTRMEANGEQARRDQIAFERQVLAAISNMQRKGGQSS